MEISPLLPAPPKLTNEPMGVLLALGGLAVTPLYINAYLMMDDEIPPK